MVYKTVATVRTRSVVRHVLVCVVVAVATLAAAGVAAAAATKVREINSIYTFYSNKVLSCYYVKVFTFLAYQHLCDALSSEEKITN